jgi:hypothetical protein
MKNEEEEVDRKKSRRQSLKDKKTFKDDKTERIRLPQKGRKKNIRFDDEDYDNEYGFFSR